jgi:hypothetical protein
MPAPYDATRCKRCGGPIVWAVTAKGRRQALNAAPDPSGNTAVYRDGIGRLRARGISSDRPTVEHAETLHMPHTATCTTPTRRTR